MSREDVVPTLRWSKVATFGALILFLLATISAFHISGAKDRRGSDDNVWLYYTGVEVAAPEATKKLNAQLIDGLEAIGYEEWLYRVTARADYAYNYLLPSFIYNRVGALSAWMTDRQPSSDYPQHMANALEYGFLLCFLLSLAIATGGIWLGGNRTILLAYLLTGIVLAAVYMIEIPQPTFILLNRTSLWDGVKHAVAFFINPHSRFSTFGFTPRSNFIMLTMLVFALRWMDRRALAYWVVVALSFVHQSLAGLTLSLLIVLDLIIDPRRLLRWPVIVPIVMGLALFVVRETLWKFVGIELGLSVLLASMGIVGVFYLFRRSTPSKWFEQVWLPTARYRASIAGWRPEIQDICVFVFGWLATLIPVMIINAQVSAEQSQFFWGQLHGRILSVMRPNIYFAIVLGLLYWWIQSRPPLAAGRLLHVAVLCVAAVPIVSAVLTRNSAAAVVLSDVRALESRLNAISEPYTEAPSRSDESLWYYAMSREIETSRPGISMLFPRPNGDTDPSPNPNQM